MKSNLAVKHSQVSASVQISEAQLRALEKAYCSYGDTVHYMEQPKFFTACEGSYLYDAKGTPYLDLQMWYSAVSFGYRNPRLNAAAQQRH